MSDNNVDYVRLAILEARKSQSEDSRPHPRVGVVVVRDGTILAAGHRGESGPGDHAEFSVLEKQLADVKVAGATVYTTLEPCTTRNHPKLPCAKRLIERKVARVLIGMLDPNPVITGKGQRMLRDANLITELFPAEFMAEVEELNRDFARAQQPPAILLASSSSQMLPASIERKIIATLTRTVVDIGRITNVPVDEIGIHLWLARIWPGELTPKLGRIARVRLSDATPSRERYWANGEGIVGLCWRDQTDKVIDLTNPVYSTATREQWGSLPEDITQGLSFNEFFERSKHFKLIAASPVVPHYDAIGCISLNFDRESTSLVRELWNAEVKRALRSSCSQVSLHLE